MLYLREMFLKLLSIIAFKIVSLIFLLKVNESWYIALFVFSGSIKSCSQLILSIFIFFSIFFALDFAEGIVWGYPALPISWFIDFKDGCPKKNVLYDIVGLSCWRVSESKVFDLLIRVHLTFCYERQWRK